MKRAIAVTTTVGMVSLLAVGVAAGHKTSAVTTVEDLKAQKPAADPTASVQITGRVAAVTRCRGGRTVTAFDDVNPRGPSLGDVRLGEDLTDANGLFAIVPPNTLQPDKVYVLVKKRVNRKPGHRHKCKRAQSNTVPVKSNK